MNKRLIDAELAMHALLDGLLDNRPVDFEGLTVPLSVVQRIRDALEDGTIEGTLKVNGEKNEPSESSLLNV